MIQRVGRGAAAAFLALQPGDAFVLPHFASHPARPPIVAFFSSTVHDSPQEILSEDQALHTAERLSGMSRGEIQHIFEDVDTDGNGSIDIAEIDLLLSKYFPCEAFSPALRKRIMKDIDTDGNGVIDEEEFYKWMVVHAKSQGSANEEGTKQMQMRTERLEVGKDGIDPKLMNLLEEVRKRLL